MTDPITRIVQRNLCTGCGACAGLFPDQIQMTDDPSTGLRPVVANTPEGYRAATQAVDACAGQGMDHTTLPTTDRIDNDWGPVLATWEGWAADEEIRHRGSSGGAVTALTTFMIETSEAAGVAHITASDDDPTRNESRISRDRAGLLRGAGSRYSPAAPCEQLGNIAAGEEQIALVGKPCDIASAKRASQFSPALAANLGPLIAIFCAGAPSRKGTEALLTRLGVPEEADVNSIRYRGEGWPGTMQATYRMPNGAIIHSDRLTYAQGWGGVLQAERPWRCRICADHTGEFADISVGDPWHSPPKDEAAPGRSLIVARTERGRRIVEAAIESGALVAEPRGRDVIAQAQPNLMDTRGAVWGRRVAMRICGLAVPRDRGLGTFRVWCEHLSAWQRVQSVAGTLKRIWRRRLWRTIRVGQAR
ncbi:MAG: Coenzyme F420 hydrogenase/dehydrogenase, beta subunit C-terminal domain [Pseudomonadota bacterium]